MQYRNNIGQLRDTIQFGSDFNPLINSMGNFTNNLQTINGNCKNTNRNAENVETNRVYEIGCETDSRASIQFTKPSNLNYHSYYK